MINVLYWKFYFDYVNDLCVEEVKCLLLSWDFVEQKIVIIVYEGGFNFLFMFYSIFKKEIGVSFK